MTQDERDKAWSGSIANSVVEELVRGKLLKETDWKRAEAVVAQQIHIHLISGDRPEGRMPPKSK